jgi:hypothetical protein
VTEAWSVEQLIAVRIANQGLTHRADPDPHAVARRTVGVQAQDVPASHLAMRSRCADLDMAGSVASLEQPASVVRTWLMRGTLHAVAIEDVRWLTGLMGPALLKRFRTHRVEHSLTDAMLAKAQTALPAILGGRELTRAELVRELDEAGVRVRTPGQGPAHFTVWASSVGLICRGAERGRELTYALLDDWIPPGPLLDESAAYIA